MPIRFNSVGLPTGIDTEGLSSAATQTATGIAAIGAGLTNLGARKDARDTAAKEKMQNQALEYFTLKATNATSEDELLAVGKEMEVYNAAGGIPGRNGGAVKGGAAALSAINKDWLTSSGIKLDNTIKDIEADTNQAALDATNLTNKFNTDEAGVISQALLLSTGGDVEGFRALLAKNLPRLQATYGDNASKLMEEGVIALAQAETDQNLIDERSDENRKRDRDAIQLEIVNKFGNRDLERVDTEAGRLAAEAEKNRGLDEEAINLASKYVNVNSVYEDVQIKVRAGTISPKDALYLTNAVKEIYETTDPNQTAGAGIDVIGDASAFEAIQTKEMNKAPGAKYNLKSVKYNPGAALELEVHLDNLAKARARNNVDIPSEVSSIAANAELLQQRDPVLKVLIAAGQFNNNVVKPDGTQVKLFEVFDLQNANGNQVIPNFMRTKITNVQKEYNLTDGEVLAILQDTIKSDTNPFILLPKGKQYGVREVDFTSFKKKAEAWRQTNTGEAAAKRTRIARQVVLAEGAEAKIKDLELQYVLASQKGNVAEMEKLSKMRDKEIDTLTGLSSYMNKEVGTLNQTGNQTEAANLLQTYLMGSLKLNEMLFK